MRHSSLTSGLSFPRAGAVSFGIGLGPSIATSSACSIPIGKTCIGNAESWRATDNPRGDGNQPTAAPSPALARSGTTVISGDKPNRTIARALVSRTGAHDRRPYAE
jgi:hypothetical protein